jgi:hypothetical protein
MNDPTQIEGIKRLYHAGGQCDLMSRLGAETYSLMSEQEEMEMAKTGPQQKGKHLPSPVSKVASVLWMR